jgi:uncharacterized membrane protein YphA (DoxX/SURF4 family)
MQRFFSAFPGGWPGLALLLLRAALGLALVLEAGSYLRDPDPTPAMWFAGWTGLLAGVMLLIGLLTPIAGTVSVVSGVAIALSLLPRAPSTLFDSKLAGAFALTMAVGIVVLGPGAFSVDARMFGRREIIIPSQR